MRNKYFSMATEGNEADIFIFGDITSWEWVESDVSSYSLAKAISALADVSAINVHINSYGGEVAEGIAIYNSLKNHTAKIRTICDGFACSAASVVFMAGDERIMNASSLLMIHNAWCCASGNADDFRKAADDLDTISATAAESYKGKISITDDELDKLLKDETWIKPADALAWGFATEVKQAEKTEKPSASARNAIMRCVTVPPAGATEIRITDLNEIKEMQKELAAIKTAICLPQEKVTSKTPMDFFKALMGGKEE